MNQTNNDQINLGRLSRAANGDEAFMRSMLQLFIDRTPAMINEMKRACENKDFEKTVRVAHRLKPSVDMIGNNKMRELIQEIHTITKDRLNCEKSPELIKKFDAQFKLIFDLITQKLKSKNLIS